MRGEKTMSKTIDPILEILETGKIISFHAIYKQISLSRRTLQRRLNVLTKEGKIKKYRSLQDARKFPFALAGD